MTTNLTGIPETLLIPLWARAVEGDRPDPIVTDDKAAEMVSQIDYDFSKFESARLSQLGVAIHTMLLDKAVSAFLRCNPEAVVVNLGAGLDTRHDRLGLEEIDDAGRPVHVFCRGGIEVSALATRGSVCRR